MKGLKKKEVRLEKYSFRYKEVYAREEKHLRQLLKDDVIDFSHVGSTAIPDILSKPCIDILVGVKNMKTGRVVADVLSGLHYERKLNFARPDQHILLVKGGENNRTAYIHIVRHKGKIWKDRIFFRDYLNKNSKIRRQYERVKVLAATKFPTSRTGYTNAKTEFVKNIFRKRK